MSEMKCYDLTAGKSWLLIAALKPKNEKKKFFLLRRAFRATRSSAERLGVASRACVWPVLTGVKWEEFNNGRENR